MIQKWPQQNANGLMLDIFAFRKRTLHDGRDFSRMKIESFQITVWPVHSQWKRIQNKAFTLNPVLQKQLANRLVVAILIQALFSWTVLI